MMDLDFLPDLNYYYHSKKQTFDGTIFYTYLGLRFWYITKKQFPELLTMTFDQIREFTKKIHWNYIENLNEYLSEALRFNLGEAFDSFAGTTYQWNGRVKKDEIEWLKTVNQLLN